MCNCIANIKTQLMTSDPAVKDVNFLYTDVLCVTKNALTTLPTAQGIEIIKEYKQKKGSPRIVRQKSMVTHQFCPFCGVSYQQTTTPNIGDKLRKEIGI